MVFTMYLEQSIPFFFKSKLYNSLTEESTTLKKEEVTSKKSRLFLVKDIPDYLKLETDPNVQGYTCKRIKQYPGFALNLKSYDTLDSYLLNHLSKRNRKNILSKKRALEKKFNIHYEVYHGAIDKDLFETLFENFKDLLTSRFDTKKMQNRNLQEWDYLKNLSYTSILDKKASLFVIYDNQVPINLTLNFHVGSSIYSHMQSFKEAYKKFSLGDISMLKQIEWCIENQVLHYDFVIGPSYYKQKWANHRYTYQYALFIKRSSPLARILAPILVLFHTLKQFLRSKNIIGGAFSLDRIKHIITFKKTKHK